MPLIAYILQLEALFSISKLLLVPERAFNVNFVPLVQGWANFFLSGPD